MKIRALVQTLLLGAALALPASALALDATRCRVDEVATFPNRVHVRCSDIPHSLPTWPRYFAVPSGTSEATRLVTLGSAAFMDARDLLIRYDILDMNAAQYGCDNQNCRRPIEIQLNKEFQFE